MCMLWGGDNDSAASCLYHSTSVMTGLGAKLTLYERLKTP